MWRPSVVRQNDVSEPEQRGTHIGSGIILDGAGQQEHDAARHLHVAHLRSLARLAHLPVGHLTARASRCTMT